MCDNRQDTEKNLEVISCYIENGWEFLAEYLKISYAKEENEQTNQQQIYNMLLKWQDRESHLETLNSLFTKMSEVPEVTVKWNELEKKFSFYTVFQQHLISHYREVCSMLQLNPFMVDGYASYLLETYISPTLHIPVIRRPKESSENAVKSYSDIFSRNVKDCHKIYISSAAGCGKTTFCKRMALSWCQAHLPIESDNKWFNEVDIDTMRQFKFLFYIQLHGLEECDIDIMIENLFQNIPAIKRVYSTLGLEFLQKVLSNEKCLIVMDGLDEWRHPVNTPCKLTNKQIPHSRARSHCMILTTSRPWRLDVARLKPEDVDLKLELNGLEGDMLERLIDNAFKEMNKLYKTEMKAKDFKVELKAKNLVGLCKNPVLVMQLLTMWFDDKPIGDSRCQLYTNMVAFLFERYLKGKGTVENLYSEKREGADCKIDTQIPVCLSNNVYCNTHMGLLSKLGKLAFYTLFGEDREASLVFDMTIALNYITDAEKEICLKVGLLSQEKLTGKMAKRQSNVFFIAKTFQEFLAALYLALDPGNLSAIEKKMMRDCCSIENMLDMSQMFVFMSGLCPQVMSHFYEPLRRIVSADALTIRFRSSCELNPWRSNEGESLMQVQDIMRDCLVESQRNGHRDIHLPVSDVFICGQQSLDEFKSLIFNNSISSLCVFSDVWDISNTETYRDILSSITVFSSLKKLWLTFVPESFVAHLLSQLQHSFIEKSESRSCLECVTLKGNISGNMLCSLVDFILKLPRSVKVRLEFYCFNDTTSGSANMDWKQFICSHPQLTIEVNFDNVDDNIYLFQFHTNKDKV